MEGQSEYPAKKRMYLTNRPGLGCTERFVSERALTFGAL